MALLVVNPNGEFKIFRTRPQRCKKSITKKADYLEEDNHGHFYHPDIPTGKFIYFWAIPTYDPVLFYDEGLDINKNSLSKELQNLKWMDEPKEI